MTATAGSSPEASGDGAVRLVLASASPARLLTLRRAGLQPEVVVSGIDEDDVQAADTRALVAELAARKATAVSERISPEPSPPPSPVTVVIGCDSLLELDGRSLGKPLSVEGATRRWRAMRGRSGVLHTGHHVILHRSGQRLNRAAVASTLVHFADVSDTEIDAYVRTGEPLEVAGAFTIDGLGGPFVTGIEGDHHNVVGVSLPLLRVLLADLGLAWPRLWQGR